MKDVEKKMIERAAELLKSGEVARVVGWKKGEFYFDPSPASFETEAELSEFAYNGFCGANLSKYLIAASKKPGKTGLPIFIWSGACPPNAGSTAISPT